MRTVFTEYVWNMGWCDLCAAPLLSREELRAVGVFWLDDSSPGGPQPRADDDPADDEPANLSANYFRYRRRVSCFL
jgi:hypothetical protein